MPRLILADRSVEVAAVIFDKDGTLTDFPSYWGPLIEHRAQGIAAHPDCRTLGVSPDMLLKLWGFHARVIRPDGILAQGNRAEAMTAAMVHLHAHGLGWNEARRIVAEVFHQAEQQLSMSDCLKAVPGVPDMIQALVAAGVQVAVASTATRKNIDDSLDVLGLSGFVPFRIGSDQVAQGKPHPEMVESLCRVMGVGAHQCAVVGDGVSDMEMGRRAGVALNVAVLTGVDDEARLRPLADVVLPSAAQLRAEADQATAKPTAATKAIMYTDGAARGNPGPAAIGVVVQAPEGRILSELGRKIGVATNNVAEYRALVAGLEEAQRLGVQELDVRADSELMVKQMLGAYQVRHPDLLPLYQAAKKLSGLFRRFGIRHVRREENKRADALANHALDS